MTPRPSNPLGERSAKLSSLLTEIETLPQLPASKLKPLLKVLGVSSEMYFSIPEVAQLAKAIFEKTADEEKPQQASTIIETLGTKCHGDKTDVAIIMVHKSPLNQRQKVATNCGVSMLKLGEIRFEGIFRDKLKTAIAENAIAYYVGDIEASEFYSDELSFNHSVRQAREKLGLI